jgi:hypothetical protein
MTRIGIWRDQQQAVLRVAWCSPWMWAKSKRGIPTLTRKASKSAAATAHSSSDGAQAPFSTGEFSGELTNVSLLPLSASVLKL